MNRKILFAATGEIAVPTFKALAKKGLISAVLTAPDKPGKRGKGLIPSPIKVAATELSIPILQPEHLGKIAREEVLQFDCDTLLSFCYGKIFGPKFLALFEGNAYNIHPSLLPKYRGCAPIESALLNGDKISGITIQKLALECDSGEIVYTETFDIKESDNAVTLSSSVSLQAALMAEKVFENEGVLPSVPQSGKISFSPLIKKEDGYVDFNSPSQVIAGQIKAYYPWPKVLCIYKDTELFLCSVSSYDEVKTEYEPGYVISYDKKRGFQIATGDGSIYIDRLQLATKKELDAASFKNGNSDFVSSLLKKK